MGFSGYPVLRGSVYRSAVQASFARVGHSKSCKGGSQKGWFNQTGYMPFLATFVCDAVTGGWLRHPNGTRTARAQRREHDDDLHSCLEPWRARRIEPGGSALIDFDIPAG